MSAVLFAGCSTKKTANPSEYSSDLGYIPESFIPKEVGMTFGYQVKGDTNNEPFLDYLSEQLDSQLSEDGSLNFEEDILPALGEEFRMSFGSLPSEVEGETRAFLAATLEDAEAMENVLETLVDSGQMDFTKLNKADVYVSSDGGFYAGLYEDVLLTSSSAEDILFMLDLKDEESLWSNEEYQAALVDVGADALLHLVLFPGNFSDEEAVAGITGAGFPNVIDYQALAVNTGEDGYLFDVYIVADEEEAAELGFAFDAVPSSKPYLSKEMPADDLMLYFESFGLQQSFELASALEGDSNQFAGLEDFFRAYFSMDFEEEVLSFWDKGYALAVQKNGEGVVPGVSLLIDVSSDKELAADFLTKLDGQIGGLMFLFEASLPGAVTKGKATIAGAEFDLLDVDLTALEGFNTGHAPLPTSVTSSVIRLAYGMLSDDRLLITTAKVWEEEFVTLEDGDLYKTLAPELGKLSEGLVFLDAQELSGYASSLRSLREQLELGVADTALGLEDILAMFEGGILASESSATRTHFGGFLKLSE